MTFKAFSPPSDLRSLLPLSVRIVCANLSSLRRCLGVLSAALIEVYLKCVFINVKMTIIPVMFEVGKRDFCIRKFRKCEYAKTMLLSVQTVYGFRAIGQIGLDVC